MKRNYIIYIVISCIALLSSCQNNMLNAGASSLDQQDEIRVMADTFLLTSTLQECAAIRFTPDSFLLGECDTRFGTIKADILTQLACPLGNEYPYADQATVDSVVLYLYYQNWYGDGLSPLGINVYEMDVATLDYSSSYPSDTTLSSFCSLSESTHIAERSRIAYAARHTDSIALTDGRYMPCISVKLTDDFAKRFFAIKDFSSQEQFNQLFKGLYITTDFGGSTVLYIKQINMAVFYSFDAPHDQQQDSIIHSAKIFYANSEVRQLNRYIYPHRDQMLQQLQQITDTNYIISPANIYTRLSLRMDSISKRIKQQLDGQDENYRIYVNRANLNIDVLYDATSTNQRDQWNLPASYMLLIEEEKMDEFFRNNQLPSDTTAILASLSSELDSLGNAVHYYSYDLSGFMTHQMRLEKDVEEFHFILMPVAVATESAASSNITSIKPLQTITATQIRSSRSIDQPMDIEMVYSGFHKMLY